MSSPKKKYPVNKYEKPDGPPPNTVSDYHKYRIESMMKNIDKPLNIPERPKDKGAPKPKEFFRNVMGSTAGAGSGEFHVFRATRRHEYARAAYYDAQQKKDEQDTAFAEKRMREEDELQKAADKRRAKRQKKKAKKNPKKEDEKEPEIKKMMARPADLDGEDASKASENPAAEKSQKISEAKASSAADKSESAEEA